MKKIVLSLMLGGLVMLGSGCAALMPISSYNANRVRDNAIQEQIIAKGNPDQIRALNAGVTPRNVVRIIPTSDLKGAYAAVDLLNPDTWTMFRTFREAPVSSSFALLGDGTLWGSIAYGVVQVLGKNSNKQETNISVDNGSGSTVINNKSGGNSTTIKTGGSGDGSTVINNDGSNGNTTTIDNSKPESTP